MAKAKASAENVHDWRSTLFRAGAVACLLLLLASGGITSILAPWASPGGAFRGFTPEIHRWHSGLLGVTEAILLPGLLLALLRRTRERPLLMQFFIFAAVALVLAHLLTRGSTPISSVFIVFPLLAYPAPRALLRFPRCAQPSRRVLALAALVAVPLTLDFWQNLQAQLAGIGGEHAQHGHWATASSLNVVLGLAVFLAACRDPGAQALGWIASIAFVYLGSAAISLPEHAGSWSIWGGASALVGGIALAVTMWWEGGASRSPFRDSSISTAAGRCARGG